MQIIKLTPYDTLIEYRNDENVLILCDASKGNFTINLPNPNKLIKPITLYILKTDETDNKVTISGIVNGLVSSNCYLEHQYYGISLICDRQKYFDFKILIESILGDLSILSAGKGLIFTDNTAGKALISDGTRYVPTTIPSTSGALLLDQTTPQTIINGAPFLNAGLSVGDAVRPAVAVVDVSKIVKVSPTMTSNSAPSPYVTSSLNEYAAAYAAWRALDGYVTSDRYWLGTTTTNWWKIDCSYAIFAVVKYILKPGIYAAYLPKTWTFEGSANNSTWTVLETRTNITFVNNVDQTFTFANTTKYRYYRLNITASNDVTYVCIPEIELYANQTSLYTNTSGQVSVGSNLPSAKLSLDSDGGLASGFALNLTNPNSYTPFDFNTPSGGTPYGLAGQFALTGSGFVSGNAFNVDAVILSNALTNGSIQLVSFGSRGVIEFVTGGLTTSNKRLRIDSAGNLLLIRDDTKIKLGAGDDFSLNYDGTNANINTAEVAASDLKLTCGAGKTLELQNVVYDDFNTAISTGKVPAANYPAWTAMIGNIYQYTFAVDDYIQLESSEFLHSWKEGTALEIHVHWVTNGNNDATVRGVKWEAEYAWANIQASGGTVVFAATSGSAETSIAANEVSLTHKYTSVLSFTPSGGKIGAQIIIRIKRIASVTNVAPANNPFCLSVGIHHQIDTIGSRSISSK